MDDSTMQDLQEELEHKHVTKDSLKRLCMSEVHRRRKKGLITKTIKITFCIAISIFITYLLGMWAIESAYKERGYVAYGGEYLFIAFVFSGCIYIMSKLFAKEISNGD